jgi:hypothetical protein
MLVNASGCPRIPSGVSGFLLDSLDCGCPWILDSLDSLDFPGFSWILRIFAALNSVERRVSFNDLPAGGCKLQKQYEIGSP